MTGLSQPSTATLASYNSITRYRRSGRIVSRPRRRMCARPPLLFNSTSCGAVTASALSLRISSRSSVRSSYLLSAATWPALPAHLGHTGRYLANHYSLGIKITLTIIGSELGPSSLESYLKSSEASSGWYAGWAE